MIQFLSFRDYRRTFKAKPLRGYLESLLEDGLSIPPDKTPIAESVAIALAS
jgi:hypothetical protein